MFLVPELGCTCLDHHQKPYVQQKVMHMSKEDFIF